MHVSVVCSPKRFLRKTDDPRAIINALSPSESIATRSDSMSASSMWCVERRIVRASDNNPGNDHPPSLLIATVIFASFGSGCMRSGRKISAVLIAIESMESNLDSAYGVK
uniref:Uncharacterized protein n=1 Tax=Pristionchus pacificus TaxID=54126 RepID=A0A2A6B7R9_PRIPA|eukprot:PDM61929.1 hypothetical protein PRIPAC_51371 [Pristionchus pacificus]